MDGIHVQVRLGEDPKVCLLIVGKWRLLKETG